MIVLSVFVNFALGPIFTYAMAAVEFRLVLQSMGIGTVDVRRLVDAVDGMREQLGYFAHRAAVPTV